MLWQVAGILHELIEADAEAAVVDVVDRVPPHSDRAHPVEVGRIREVTDLARRYPRTFGSTIPKGWYDDAETVELLALICRWRAELDHQEAAGIDGAPLDDLLFPETGIEHARHAWEWHAHRDHWLARLAETGIASISAEGF